MRLRLLAALAAAAALAACSSPTSAPPLRHLDRPGDIAFGCVGVFPSATNVSQAMTPLSCATAGIPPGTPDGGVTQVDGGSAEYRNLAFVIEPVRGALSVARIPNGGFIDSDRYAPGLSGVAVGRQPVAVTTSVEGCYAVTANAGSCDLSRVDVVRAVASSTEVVSNLPVLAGADNKQRILARPTNVVARSGGSSPFGSNCDAPSEVYVTFESCHLMARVDLHTGKMLDGVLSLPGEAPRIVGPGDVSCPVECSAEDLQQSGALAPVPQEDPVDAGPVDAGPADAGPLPVVGAKPSALGVELDLPRVYFGGRDSNGLVIVDLDADGKPTNLSVVELEGDVGIVRISPSGPVTMGNNNMAPERVRRWVYAIATDGSIRVVDVTPGREYRECDTQIDRRYLHDETDLEKMFCLRIGDPENPRRAGVDGPGIRLPRGVLPLDIAFVRAGVSGTPNPLAFNGVFALVSAVGPVADDRLGRAALFVINVDDDNYDDSEPESPTNDVELVLPHTLREGTANRAETGNLKCTENTTANAPPVRIDPEVARPSGFYYADTGTDTDSIPFAPEPRRAVCSYRDTATGPEIPETRFAPYTLQATAPDALRKQSFADLERIAPRSMSQAAATSNEQIVVMWEGPMSLSSTQAARSGGKLRPTTSSQLELTAPGGLLCDLGGEDGDIVQLTGCNSSVDCAFDETCVIHPDTPAGLNGMCAPRDHELEYVSACRSLLISARRYTAVQLFQDRAVLNTRPDVLAASPIEGCVDAGECAAVENTVLGKLELLQGVTTPYARHDFLCERDVAMGGPKRCLYACSDDSDCNTGAVCLAGRCLLAPVPAPECLSPLQNYELRGGDSFMILSSQDTFEHRQMVDPATGRCVENPALSPLIGNRVHRLEPPCSGGDGDPTGESVETIAPNPCQLTNLTVPQLDANARWTLTRPSYGMRMRGPGMSIDIADVAATITPKSDTQTYPDVLVSAIPSGFSFRMSMVAGFAPYAYSLPGALPQRARTAPDGAVWVVDSGDSAGGLIRGQVVKVNLSGPDQFTNPLR